MIPKNLGDKLVVKDLKPNASVTTTTVSSAIDLDGLEGEILAMLDVSAPVAGTTPGLAVKLTHCDTSGGSYTDVTGGGFTAAASAQTSQSISLNKNDMKRFVKLSWTISGTDSPQYYVSSKILGMNRYA